MVDPRRDRFIADVMRNETRGPVAPEVLDDAARMLSVRGVDPVTALGLDPPEEHDELAVSGSVEANRWMGDPSVVDAELTAFMAERAMRRGGHDEARVAYRKAAWAFAEVAATVPATHPNTRSDLAVSAVTCLVRARAFGEASALAQQFLAEPESLAPHGRSALREAVASIEPDGLDAVKRLTSRT